MLMTEAFIWREDHPEEVYKEKAGMDEKNNNGWGGKRDGAGRKRILKGSTNRISICVSDDVIKWIEANKGDMTTSSFVQSHLQRLSEEKRYYVTRNTTEIHPMVFTPQKADRMEDYLIMDMLVLLMKREYEEYGAEVAMENINYQLSLSTVFNGATQAPKPDKNKEIPNLKEMEQWAHDLYFFTEAGINLNNQEGAKLYPAETKQEKWLTEDATLSDFLGSLWTAEGDYQ